MNSNKLAWLKDFIHTICFGGRIIFYILLKSFAASLIDQSYIVILILSELLFILSILFLRFVFIERVTQKHNINQI